MTYISFTKDNFGKRDMLYAYIIGKDEILEYDIAVSSDFTDTTTDYSKFNYIGEGYICGYDVYGKLWTDQELSKFYTRNK